MKLVDTLHGTSQFVGPVGTHLSWLAKGDVVEQKRFIERIFGIAA
jgi:hypothetical protein